MTIYIYKRLIKYKEGNTIIFASSYQRNMDQLSVLTVASIVSIKRCLKIDFTSGLLFLEVIKHNEQHLCKT